MYVCMHEDSNQLTATTFGMLCHVKDKQCIVNNHNYLKSEVIYLVGITLSFTGHFI